MKKLILILSIGVFYSISAQQKPTLYLIGDSTMSDKVDPSSNPEHGWGQLLPTLMNTSLEIKNHAVNGRSSKSFIDEGYWQTVVNNLNKNDFVFIQFGHNDQKIKDSARYTNAYTGYRHNLERFVLETREKGAIPILFSSIVRRKFTEFGVLEDTHGAYPLVARLVAERLKVPFIDLQWLTERLETQYGPEKSKLLHLHIKAGENAYVPNGVEDDTHLSKKGATLVASLALQELVRKFPEFEKFVQPEIIEMKILVEE